MTFLKKLRYSYIWKRILYERLTEPLHLNLMALPVLAFGSFRMKVACDLVLRQPNAFAILRSADEAVRLGISELTIIEFGVAAGAGLHNMAALAQQITQITGVKFHVVGFDTGVGMPPPQDYRDHPDLYRMGDFPMDFGRLSRSLPPNARLVLGDVATTLPKFIDTLSPSRPIGYISIDVDTYSSSRAALQVLTGPSAAYLPVVPIYVDDLEDVRHNSRCGELAAIEDFNNEHSLRLIERHAFLRSYRLFRNARWIDHMFFCHVLDHPHRLSTDQHRSAVVLENPYH